MNGSPGRACRAPRAGLEQFRASDLRPLRDDKTSDPGQLLSGPGGPAAPARASVITRCYEWRNRRRQ
ncbi:hypothetical protein [Amycolatopsis sp. La24]|uniref:hypothetical protein n=1 Tax=Amycolatopsis sp. La24 TaxID=3028304 RepID=UPI0023B0190E|nr:hypothetical protein [Amycolatopsis sp. La24]